MKPFRMIVVAICGLSLAAGAMAQTAAGRIVTVDMQKVFDAYHKTPVARGKLEETRDQFTKELQSKQEELKAQVEDLNKLREDQDRPEYTPEIRDQKRKELNEKLAGMQKFQRDVEEYRRSHQKILEEQSLRMRQGILKEITDVVQKEARDAGYLLVVDKSGNTLNGMPTLVYAQDNIDVTADIIKILNKNAPSAGAGAAPNP